jgi:GTP-binding protein LepA
VLISAKTGVGIPDVLEAIVTRLPAPKGDRDAPLKAMLVDSWYDAYLGVVVLIRVIDGVIRKGDRIRMMQTGATYGIDKLAVLRPAMVDIPELGPGEIGVLTASIKQVRDTRVGDTITHEKKGAADPAAGLQPLGARWCSAGCSRRQRRIRGSARRDRETGAERCELHL